MLLFFSDIYPGIELLGHVVVLFLVFWETSILFSIGAAPVYISTNSVGGFPLLHIFTKICYLCSFWWWPFWQVWGSTSLWFWFAFPWGLAILSYSNQNSMVLAQKQIHRSMEQNRDPRDKPAHFWLINLWQRKQEYTMEKTQSLQ